MQYIETRRYCIFNIQNIGDYKRGKLFWLKVRSGEDIKNRHLLNIYDVCLADRHLVFACVFTAPFCLMLRCVRGGRSCIKKKKRNTNVFISVFICIF